MARRFPKLFIPNIPKPSVTWEWAKRLGLKPGQTIYAGSRVGKSANNAR